MNEIKCDSIKRNEFEITRTFDVPREFLWKTLTTDNWRSWWKPKNYKLQDVELDPAGKYYGCMKMSDDKDLCVKGEFREVIPNEKLVLTDSFADKESIVAPADYYGSSEDWPPEMEITVTLDDLDGKTRLILKHSGLIGIDCINMEQEWNSFFDELDDNVRNEMKGEDLWGQTVKLYCNKK